MTWKTVGSDQVRNTIDRLIPLRVRAAALLPAAALTVHQLRFELAYGDHAEGKLASEGHAYLSAFTPLAAMLVAVAAGLFLARFARARRSGDRQGGGHFGFLRMWLAVAAALVLIYSGQELLEGFLSSGHPEGMVGIFGGGGWWAIPLALLAGAVVALLLRVADANFVAWVRPEPLATAAAGRAPPVAAAALAF